MSMPAYPSPDTGAVGPAPVARPASVNLAFQALIAVSVLSIIGVALSLLSLPAAFETAMQQARASSPDLTPEQAQFVGSATRIGLIIVAVIVVVVVGLLVLFTFKMRAGRNWARITLTVVGGIGVVFYGFSLIGISAAIAAGGLTLVGTGVTILTVLLLIAAIVFMFRADANPFFNRR